MKLREHINEMLVTGKNEIMKPNDKEWLNPEYYEFTQPIHSNIFVEPQVDQFDIEV
jgi:hypothetical protein